MLHSPVGHSRSLGRRPGKHGYRRIIRRQHLQKNTVVGNRQQIATGVECMASSRRNVQTEVIETLVTLWLPWRFEFGWK